ncbi:MAG: IS21 family transposase, partial [Candidatus Dormibacteria bacterium]
RTAVPGEIRKAQVLVATLGYSNYTYVEAMWQMDSAATLNAVCNALEYFGGVPEVIVPDNMKTAVTRPNRYEAEIARPFEELAQHYGCVVIPTRPRKPKDKAKVENEVLHAERNILAVFRNRTFFSLKELNQAIWEQLELLNTAPLQGRDESRAVLLEEERPELQQLVLQRYEYAVWYPLKVHPDSHIQVNHHCYSVPCLYVHKHVDVRVTAHIVEIFFQGKRIASHQRSALSSGSTTIVDHLPSSHQEYAAQQTQEYYLERARGIGPYIEDLILAVMEKKKHPELGFRACLGILSLAKGYPNERLESAAQRALLLGSFSYHSVKSILSKGIDQRPYVVPPAHTPIVHENVRGADYYNTQGELV